MPQSLHVETYHIYALDNSVWKEVPTEYLPVRESAQHLMDLLHQANPHVNYRIIKRTVIEDVIEEITYKGIE